MTDVGIHSFPSGNHAQALALAARTRNIPAYIVMPTISTPSKIAATKGYGAEVIFSGSTSEEREAVMQDVMKRTGATFIPAYDHPNILLGQGTMALELEKQVQELVTLNQDLSVHSPSRERLPTVPTTSSSNQPYRRPGHLDAVIAPCGGGGMLSGIATALHGTNTLVYGAEPSFQSADDARRSLLTGSRIPSVKTLTIADGLRTPLGHIPWSIIRDGEKVQGVYAVSEEQIKEAMRLVFERMKVVVEPSAVVGLAVALWDEEWRREVERKGGKEGWDVGIVLSGGNTTVEAMVGLFGKGNGDGDRNGNGNGEGENEAEKEREMGKVGMGGERVAENVPG